MRWKLKDTVAKCIRPRSGEGCAAWTFVMRKPQNLAQAETKQKGKKTQNKPKFIYQNRNCTTENEHRWFIKEAGTRDSSFCNYWKTCPTTNWVMVCLMMSHFPLILNVSGITNTDHINWTDHKQPLWKIKKSITVPYLMKKSFRYDLNDSTSESCGRSESARCHPIKNCNL